jgi:hypothetical protein
MSEMVNEFNAYREKMNGVILGKNNLVLKRLWNLDTNTYEEGPWIKEQGNAGSCCQYGFTLR